MKNLIFICFIVSSAMAQASVEIGTGFNSSTSGRVVPALDIGVDVNSQLLTFSSSGVATTQYYHSAYTGGFYWKWQAGEFIFGTVESGFGVGVLYAVREYAEVGDNPTRRDDFAFGPAFFSKWIFADPIFVAVEAIYGIRDLGDHLALNAQDHVSFVFGARLW